MEERDFNRLNKYALATNDILISVVGTLGNACIIQEHEVPAIFSCKSTAVKAKHINPFYLLSYLNSKYGRSLLLRKERGAIQKGLNLDDLKSLDIPLFSDSLYKSAELCIKKSLDFIQRAKQCYADAEKRLEATIIPTLSLSCSNTSIKSLKESFLHSGRLDAEYYQEKYQAYAIKASCLNSEFGAEHKLLSQMPITNFLQSIEGGKEMTLADKEKAYLWFISFVYRLRNALFHEIIDPLNDEWQVIFKNSYHVLKQVVDQNIWRLKQLKLLPSASQAAAEEDYNREPPPDIDWPTDEEAKFTWFYYEMLKLNKDGARVLLKGKIDFAEHHYETECTVRWNESLSETAIKNASITSVVDSQEKELAAAI